MKELDIGDVAQRSRLTVSTLRFYEERGLIAPVGRRGLRRQFDAGVLERLALIALGRAAGFSLDEIALMLTPGGARLDRKKLAAKARKCHLGEREPATPLPHRDAQADCRESPNSSRRPIQAAPQPSTAFRSLRPVRARSATTAREVLRRSQEQRKIVSPRPVHWRLLSSTRLQVAHREALSCAAHAGTAAVRLSDIVFAAASKRALLDRHPQ